MKSISMNRVFTSLISFAMVGAFASTASAASNVWSGTYPKTGTINNGLIAIKGTATPDPMKMLTGKATAFVWPVGGGVQTEFPNIFVNAAGDWGPTDLPGFVSGTNYNVYVSAEQTTAGGTKTWINTDTKQSKAK